MPWWNRRNRIALSMMVSGLTAIYIGAVYVSPASDAVLIEVFRQHRDAFEELVTLCEQETEVLSISPGRTTVSTAPKRSTPLPSVRLERYQQLLLEIGAEHGVEIWQSEIEIIVWVRGLMSRAQKGYVFSRIPVAPLVPSLDTEPTYPAAVHAYRHIEGHWYLVRHRG